MNFKFITVYVNKETLGVLSRSELDAYISEKACEILEKNLDYWKPRDHARYIHIDGWGKKLYVDEALYDFAWYRAYCESEEIFVERELLIQGD